MKNIYNNKNRFIVWLILAIIIFCVFSYIIFAGIKIESNILKLLPDSSQDVFADKAFDSFSNKNMKKVFFLVSGYEQQSTLEAAQSLFKNLNADQSISNVETYASDAKQTQIAQFNFEYRHQLLNRNNLKLLEAKDYMAFLERTLRLIYAPVTGGLSQTIKSDPFLLSYQAAEEIYSSFVNEVFIKDGYLIFKKDNKFFVSIAASLKSDPFTRKTQKEFLKDIEYFERSLKKNSLDIQLLKTGVIFYAADHYQQAQQEVSTIGTGSLVIIIFLIIFVFHSIKPFFLTVVALLVGILAGFCAVHLLFGYVHLIAIVFGASLIGVAVDYAFHYFVIKGAVSANYRLKKIIPAITLGLISSVIGYSSLSITPLSGLQQMALFCCTGLIFAYLTVILAFPVFRFENSNNQLIYQFCRKLYCISNSKIATKLHLLLFFAPLIAAYILLNTPPYTSDLRKLQNINSKLDSQAKEIELVVNRSEINQFYLVKGKTHQSLLQNLEVASQHLERLITQGVIDGYQSISQYVPSIQQQKYNYALYSQLYRSDVLEKLVDLNVLTNEDVVFIRKSFSQDQSKSIRLQDWLASRQGRDMSYLWLGKIENKYAAIISLSGINQIESLNSINENILFVDKVSQISTIFKKYKIYSFKLLLFAVAIIFLILCFRYSVTQSLLIISSPLIAISMVFLTLQGLGIAMNLFNTLSLFLILGIGIDYGIFFAESKGQNTNILLAVLMSSLTTLCSFGLLSFSKTPAIYDFGLSMFIGICFVLMLSIMVSSVIVKHKVSYKQNYNV